MENKQRIAGITQIDEFFTRNWFSQELSLVTGLYHLTYNGRWQCVFASDNCLKILNCTLPDFFERLKKLVAFSAYEAQKKTMGTILDDIAAGQDPSSFISVCPGENDKPQYIKGTLAVSREANGFISVYGQISDVSEEQENIVHLQSVENAHIAGMKMTGRVFYQYLIDGRRAVFQPETAKMKNIPEVVENMPEWNVKSGRIAPQSVNAWLDLFAAIDRGEPQGSAEIVFWVSRANVFRNGRVEFVSIADDNGAPIGAVVSHEDITDFQEQWHMHTIDRLGLLQTAQMTFPEILSVNLTKGTYRMIQYYGATTLGTPREGPLEQMLLPRLENVAPEDQAAFKSHFFPEGLLESTSEGKQTHLTYRRRGSDDVWHWVETIAFRLENPYDDDILAFAVSRSIDAEKAKEVRLREQLRQQSEELKITMSQMGKHICYYDVSTGALTTLPSAAREFGVPLVIENFPESFLADPPKGYPPETGELLRSFIDAIRRGDRTGSCQYPTVTADGRNVWLHREFVTIFDDDGRPVRAVISSEDVTESYVQMEENRQLKEQVHRNDQIFNLVAQHSNRTLYAYDLETCTTRPWNEENRQKDILAHLYTGAYSDGALDLNQFVLPDCVSDVKKFFADIHSGVPFGEMNVHIRLIDGQLRWYHFRYTSLFSENKPTTALISIEDVTERHEHEMAYRRHVQSVEHNADSHLLYIESDLTDDRIENMTGLLLSPEEREMQCSHSDLGRLVLASKFKYEEPEEASVYFSCENLLERYSSGERQLQSRWQVIFNDGTSHWLDTETVLIADPYDNHIKGFFRMVDITNEQELLQRADYDAMTGLLRREVGEARIRKCLEESNEKGGILITLDLDDLKGINDNLGHAQGDAAIIGIANILKSHFRKDDILIRVGGDEFIVYLPGAGESIDAIEISMTSLLQRLSHISIGENGERTIHCSVGCSVEIPGTDTYETLFKRADTALYHVKRSGKNNFAFYEPEMDQADYEFRSKKLLSAQNIKKFELSELQYLLDSIMKFYQLVLSVNVSANTYYIMEEVRDGVFARVPDFGSLDSFVKLAAQAIHPDDLDNYYNAVSRKALLTARSNGKESVQCHFRFNDRRYRWVECMVIFYTNEQGDLCDFTLLRWVNEKTNELERLRLKKILELSAGTDFEYTCLIDVYNKSYSTFSRNSTNSHSIPESDSFDNVTKHIRDTQIPPEERDIYYEKAALDHVILHMNDMGSSYSYRYTTMDGVTREASFNWYEETHSEILMTVRRIS